MIVTFEGDLNSGFLEAFKNELEILTLFENRNKMKT
jgi:hypothetical protein